MKFFKQYNRFKGQAVIEYLILLTFVAFAFILFQKYIARGIAGRWKSVGDAIGQGKIYDPDKTVECAKDSRAPNVYYEVECFESFCIDDCFEMSGSNAACRSCINSCATAICNN